MAKLFNLARMSTATTGTGTITLGSAVSGFLSFASAGASDGDTVTYAIKDGSNSEIGRGVYTSSGTTLTRSVLRSTNSNSAINLSGSAEVFITAAAEDFGGPGGPLREILTSSRNYYVRTDGSDSNNGLANTSGGAFLTIQKAIDTVAVLDLSIYNVTINVADGTYTAGITITAPWVGSGTVTLTGNTGTPANCIISTTSANCVSANNGGTLSIGGFKLQTTTSGMCLSATTNGVIRFSAAINFGACAQAHMQATTGGTVDNASVAYAISGSAQWHALATDEGAINNGVFQAVTITGTPAFSAQFCVATRLGLWVGQPAWSGAATGSRYDVSVNGVIQTYGAGTSHFPGNAAGSQATGGQYA